MAWDAWCAGTATQSTIFNKLAIISANPVTLWGKHPADNNINLDYYSKLCAKMNDDATNDLYATGLYDGKDKYMFIRVVDFGDVGKCAIGRGKGETAHEKNHLLVFSGKKLIIVGVLNDTGASPTGANYLSQVAVQLSNLG